MQIVKLHATTSTNDEMRARFRESELTHLTALYTLEQSQGRGNRGTVWQSEKGKNLTFSILISENLTGLNVFELNQIVSVALVEWLLNDLKVQAKIKWPNDILSVHKKLAGILIENTYQNNKWSHSIVGIGLNVNQEEFKDLPQAISLKNLTGQFYSLEELLISFMTYLDRALKNGRHTVEKYLLHLYRYQQIMSFELIDGEIIEALVSGVTQDGELLLEIEGQLTAYDLKQLRWKY